MSDNKDIDYYVTQYKATESQEEKSNIAGLIYQQYYFFIKKVVGKYNFKIESDDLMQESYFALLNALKRYDKKRYENFVTYLATELNWYFLRYINTNCSCSIFLDNCRIILSLDKNYSELEEPESTLIDTIASDTDIEQDFINDDMKNWLRSEADKILNLLPKDEKRILELNYIQNRTYNQIAEELCLSENQVRWKINKALSYLRKNKSVKAAYISYYDRIETIAYKSNLHNFNRTGISSTEKAVFKILDLETLLKG